MESTYCSCHPLSVSLLHACPLAPAPALLPLCSFYAQVEERRDPSLACRPLGITQKYIVVTANAAARAAGVTKLMSTAEAQRKCPGIVLIRCRLAGLMGGCGWVAGWLAGWLALIPGMLSGPCRQLMAGPRRRGRLMPIAYLGGSARARCLSHPSPSPSLSAAARI